MLTSRRVLGFAEVRAAASLGAIFLALAVVAFLWRRVIAVPAALVIAWIGAAMIAKAHSLKKQREESGGRRMRVVEASPDP